MHRPFRRGCGCPKLLPPPSPHSHAQVQGTALTGTGDRIAVLRSDQCTAWPPEGPLLQGPVGDPLDLSRLQPGPYYACLLPGGVPTAGLSAAFTVAGLAVEPIDAPAMPTTFRLSGTLVTGAAAEAVAVLPAPADCGTATALPHSVTSGRNATVDLTAYPPGAYRVCFRGASGAFTAGLYVALAVRAALSATPGTVARHVGARWTLAGGAATAAPGGRAALVPASDACAAGAARSRWQWSVPASLELVADTRYVPVGRYWLCVRPPGGEYMDHVAASVTVVALQLEDNSTVVPAAPGVRLGLSGDALEAPGAVPEVAVVTEAQTCAEDADMTNVGGVAGAITDARRCRSPSFVPWARSPTLGGDKGGGR